LLRARALIRTTPCALGCCPPAQAAWLPAWILLLPAGGAARVLQLARTYAHACVAL